MNTDQVSGIPISLYIHVPWCVKKCPYCDFNSHVSEAGIPEEAYVDRLIEDFRQDLPYLQGRPIQSIFIGGGTPSLFTPESYARLLKSLQSEAAFSPCLEVTMEANPGAIEYGNLPGYVEAGINRISFGVQSFASRQLQLIGRIHTVDEACVAVQQAKLAGFQSINIDLMFGLPDQDNVSALSDLAQAIQLEPQHISWYELTIEKNTEFYKQPPVLPHEDSIYETWQAGKVQLQAAGFEQYEVSAYAQSGFESKHNLNYWMFGDYIGIGAGAHGKVTLEAEGISRTRKTRLPKDYLTGTALLKQAMSSTIVKKDLSIEFMMNALRLSKGFSLALFEQRTGQCKDQIKDILNCAVSCGWLQWEEDVVNCTPDGYAHLNRVLELFL